MFNKAVKTLYGKEVEVDLTRPDQEFGDFATNIALKLAKEFNKNPREVAEEITQKIKDLPEITAVDIAGPGFINIRVSDGVLISAITSDLNKVNHQKVVIETNNPNPFKAMHIGHAFNAIVADTIANILERGGAETHRVSYHGDVGAHVGRSMYSLLRYVDGDPSKLDQIPDGERNTFMSRMYSEGTAAYKNDENAKQEIDSLASQSFTQEDPVYKKVYQTCAAWSFQQIDELVAELGNKPIEKRYLESQADDLGVKTVKEHLGDVFIESEGALVFPGEKHGSFNNVFVSSNGRGLYGARDLGLIQLKNDDFHPDRSYIVTAEEQRDYFKGVIKAAELCLPELKDTTINIPTGTVKLTSGKMSSRSGDVLEVGWLFEQISVAIKKRSSSDVEDVAKAAIRYQFLKVRIGNDIVFDVEEAANLQGNTGPYLQYAYVRALSILRRAQEKSSPDRDFDASEHGLLLKISEYKEVLGRAVKELMPHYIANYLYELTQEFNRFYEKNRIIDDSREAQRLYVARLYADTLKDGLSVLGIPAPEKM